MGFLRQLFGLSSARQTACSPPSWEAAPAEPPRSAAAVLTEVANANGVRRRLGLEIARGGEGRVVSLEDSPLIVKLCHPRILRDTERAERLRRKIGDMVQMREMAGHPRLAWPRALVFNPETGEWAGYVMRRLEGISLQGFAGAPAHLARHAPDWGRHDLVRLALSFLDTISALAGKRALPVDFNPCNFLVNAREREVLFIDCDGYQVQGPGGLHLCEAVRPDFAPVELLERERYDEAPASAGSLRFSVAMVLFFLLNAGNTPYRHRNGEDPVSYLRFGKCALGRGADCAFPAGPWFKVWSHLPYEIKALFIRCFRDGHRNPSQRPSVGEWVEALNRYRRGLETGRFCNDILPAAAKSPEWVGKNSETSSRHAS